MNTREEPLAEAVARIAHYGQREHSTGDEYIKHIERVVSLVEGDQARTVAWLHDVVEDCDWFWLRADEMLLSVFSPPVVDAVLRLTWGWYLPASATYDHYIADIKRFGNAAAIAVKIADLRDHLRPNCPARLRGRYEMALRVLTDSVGCESTRDE